MESFRIVTIGASAGGVEALRELVGGLPADLPAAVFIVIHLPTDSKSILPEILSRYGPLPATHAVDGEAIVPGKIYIAPPNFHLLVERGNVKLSRGPRENRTRPAIDPLFRTAAESYRNRVIGVILSGSLNDGTAGMIEIKRRNGTAIVQNPNEALYPDMPRNAILNSSVDHIVPLEEIASTITRLSREKIIEEVVVGTEKQTGSASNTQHSYRAEPKMSTSNGSGDSHSRSGESPKHVGEKMHSEIVVSDAGKARIEADLKEQELHGRNGQPATYTCPDCGGTLWEMDENSLLRFRCHTGHAFSAEALLEGQTESIERALWSGIRALREKIVLCKQLAANMRERDNPASAKHFEERTVLLEQQVTMLDRLVTFGKDGGQFNTEAFP